MSNSGGLIRRSKPLNTGKLISAYYLEIEYLLERIEGKPPLALNARIAATWEAV